MNERTRPLLDAALEAGRRILAAIDADDAERLQQHADERALLLDALQALGAPAPDDPALPAYQDAFRAQEASLSAAIASWQTQRVEAFDLAMQDMQRRRDAQRRYDAPPPRSGILHRGLQG